jgi:hypothetical protein
MTDLPSFEIVKITTDNMHNGASSTYTIDIIPRVIFYEDDSIYLNFPLELNLPANPRCTGGNILENITCTSPM